MIARAFFERMTKEQLVDYVEEAQRVWMRAIESGQDHCGKIRKLEQEVCRLENELSDYQHLEELKERARNELSVAREKEWDLRQRIIEIEKTYKYMGIHPPITLEEFGYDG